MTFVTITLAIYTLMCIFENCELYCTFETQVCLIINRSASCCTSILQFVLYEINDNITALQITLVATERMHIQNLNRKFEKFNAPISLGSMLSKFYSSS